MIYKRSYSVYYAAAFLLPYDQSESTFFGSWMRKNEVEKQFVEAVSEPERTVQMEYILVQAMKTVVQEYRMNFETIEFAVYGSKQYDTNYRVFQQILGGM